MVADSIAALFLLGLLGFILNYFAWKKSFYTIPSYPAVPLLAKHLLSIFAIYIAGIFVLPLFLMQLITTLSSALMFQLFYSLAILLALYLYCRRQKDALFSNVIKHPSSPSSPLYDLALGCSTLILVFPIIAFVSQFFDLLLYLIYELESYEQVAVRFLKMSLQSSTLKIFALLSIVLIAPIIEEFLFRGTLQSYLKKNLGTKAAILLTAAAFSVFHFSHEQGLGNLSLIPSLFTFGCFLGFLYEKQGSLLAPIGLHMSFNLLNSLRIIFE
jgi:uncharacterized protein